MSDDWFTETFDPEYQQRLQITKVLYRHRTDHQDLMIFENPRFGRVLVLDGVVQTTEGDEFIYHEMLVHVPVLAHGAVRDVCIVGGGDGGALRETLKHRTVERVTLVEIDRDVVDLCREYMPSLPDGAFDDPRTELIIADALDFMKTTDRVFDLIVVDSTDPIGPSVPLFGEAFYADCRSRLSDRGILITQSGIAFMQSAETETTYRRLERLFADAALYLAQVPTYTPGFLTLGWGCNSADPRRTPPETVRRRFVDASIETRYYNPDLHHAAFALPQYYHALLDR